MITDYAPTQCEPTEETNARILSISEDLLEGFHERPFEEIAKRCDLPINTVIQRIRTMLKAGTIRRVRQTLLATKLAEGALAAWQIPKDKLQAAFRFMADEDPFSGHIVIRSTDPGLPGAQYNLWTTLKVPQGESLTEHADVLKRLVGAKSYRLMPAEGVFTLGVGHMRRRKLPPGSMQDEPAQMVTTKNSALTPKEWTVLLALKEELTPEEIKPSPWESRAAAIGVSIEDFYRIARDLNAKGVIGRFSTFLEHVKPSATGQKVTRYNGLFHWAVPKGMEKQAGAEIGRHFCMTHCYWREGGSEFNNVNIMGVVHGTEQETLLEHKNAIDTHLASLGIPVTYTNVFWGGKSEIKPSEISPIIYREWHQEHSLTAPPLSERPSNDLSSQNFTPRISTHSHQQPVRSVSNEQAHYAIMISRPPVDRVFSDWLVQRSLSQISTSIEKTTFSIAIESPCLVCQPRVALPLATYLNEFDIESDGSSWLSITDHQLEQLQAHPELREMLGHENADDPDSAITYLSSQGRVILELPKCHSQTGSNSQVFQVSMSCKEPEESNHHLWLNAKRIPQETLIPMIANNFLDWASSGGDRSA